MTKRIVVIEPDGSERELSKPPTAQEMRAIVGGYVEHVRVLRQELPGFNYSSMFANENGLLDKLPRNQKATDLYLANVRRAYPDSENPSKDAAEAHRQRLNVPADAVHSLAPPGYDDDPYMAGTVIWFDGWTCEEVDEAFG